MPNNVVADGAYCTTSPSLMRIVEDRKKHPADEGDRVSQGLSVMRLGISMSHWPVLLLGKFKTIDQAFRPISVSIHVGDSRRELLNSPSLHRGMKAAFRYTSTCWDCNQWNSIIEFLYLVRHP